MNVKAFQAIYNTHQARTRQFKMLSASFGYGNKSFKLQPCDSRDWMLPMESNHVTKQPGMTSTRGGHPHEKQVKSQQVISRITGCQCLISGCGLFEPVLYKAY